MHKKLILIFVLLCPILICHAQPYKNLALRGGGIRGIAYTGAIKVLEEKGIITNIRQIAGTSSGAIVGALLGVGYNADELEDIMSELQIQRFNDGGGFFIGGQRRLRKHYGWYKGATLEDWMADLIAKKTGNSDLTFRQLHEMALNDTRYKDLFITATNLSRQRLEIFNWQTYPDMYIRTAVRSSISVPLYFEAVLLDSAGHEVNRNETEEHYQVYVDGGIVADYPMNVFDSGKNSTETLGLKLERPEQLDYDHDGLAPYDISSFKSYVGALYNITIETLDRSNATPNEKDHTIYISTSDLSPKVKKVKDGEKKLLYNNGREAAMKFFERH